MANKEVVIATMPAVEMYFKVPEGINLEDKSVVEWYNFRYGDLCIKYVGKDEIVNIGACYETEQNYKFALNLEIIKERDAPFYEPSYWSASDEEDESDEEEEEN
jgi:hypothetical protein